jgi:hypothetical protein
VYFEIKDSFNGSIKIAKYDAWCFDPTIQLSPLALNLE